MLNIQGANVDGLIITLAITTLKNAIEQHSLVEAIENSQVLQNTMKVNVYLCILKNKFKLFLF